MAALYDTKSTRDVLILRCMYSQTKWLPEGPYGCKGVTDITGPSEFGE